MSITAERYTAAVVSSDLGMTSHEIKSIDHIIAWGLAANAMGRSLLRLHTQWDGNEIKINGNTESVERYFLKDLPRVRAALVHWLTVKGNPAPQDMAAEAIATWLNRMCPSCKGSGEKVKNNRVYTCSACKGLRLRATHRNDVIRDAHQYMDDCIAIAASHARRLLRPSVV